MTGSRKLRALASAASAIAQKYAQAEAQERKSESPETDGLSNSQITEEITDIKAKCVENDQGQEVEREIFRLKNTPWIR